MADEFEVRNEAIEEKLRDLGNRLRDACAHVPPGTPPMGFALLLFELNEKDGATFYTSNCDRKDVLGAMTKFIEREKYRSPSAAEILSGDDLRR